MKVWTWLKNPWNITSASTVDSPVRLYLHVCKGGVFVLNIQIDDKVHDTVVVHESFSKGDDPVTVDQNVCKLQAIAAVDACTS